jgi:p-hydroxybenzoate 3-monooxygenase
MRTQVAIVGGGPAGLMLAHLLGRAGIESVVLESRPRVYAEQRVRASVLESGTVDLLASSGLGERLRQRGRVHDAIELRFDERQHAVPLSELNSGRGVTVYDQHEIVQDLIRARLDVGGQLEFEAEVRGLDGLSSNQPVVHYRQSAEQRALGCDFVVGCDGNWGICRSSIPAAARTIYQREYPFAWLGVLAAAPPPASGLVYAAHARGFALWGLHANDLTRFYLQWSRDEALDQWSDERIWGELKSRLGTPAATAPAEGPIVEKAVTSLHSIVVEPMQYGRLFLAGDAAHVMPHTAAKGLNLALADVRVLAEALATWYRTGAADSLDAYSNTCLRRAWWAEHFSWWMTWLLHRVDDEFEQRLQRAQLQQLVASRAAATLLAENYLGVAEH